MSTILVVAGTHRRGVCKHCRRSLVWALVASQRGRPARHLPFDTDAPASATDRTTTEQGVTFERWPENALHAKHCRQRPRRDQTAERLRRDSRRGQGRMW